MVSLWGPGRNLLWWVKRVFSLFVGLYTAAQAIGLPGNLLIWWRCHRYGGSVCTPFIEAVEQLPMMETDAWRIFNMALFLVCVALLLPGALWQRLAKKLRRPKKAEAAETLDAISRDMGKMLVGVLAEGGDVFVRLIAPYDQKTEQDLMRFDRKVTSLLTRLAAVPSPSYAEMVKTYASIRGDLRALRLHNESRSQNDATLGQLDALRRILELFEGEHRRSGRLSPAFVEISGDIVTRALDGAIRLERDKKRARGG